MEKVKKILDKGDTNMRCSVCNKNRNKLINGKCIICTNIELYNQVYGNSSEETSTDKEDTEEVVLDTYTFLNELRKGV